MRLVCPNCAAQYEVDESVIPEMGRDVQCSNCGQMWFQPGKAAMAEAEAPAAATPEPDGWDIAEGLEHSPAEPAPEPAHEPAPEPAAEDIAAPVAEPPGMTGPVAAPQTVETPEPSAAPAAEPEPAEDSTARSVSALISAFRAEQEPAADAQ
ncbi:MAG: zinc-ribbon domain-containing protein, partial [Sphingomonadales bacterium]|nr:zinc-ribbon domain-containing protein [Sphingomonadales bacterium]